MENELTHDEDLVRVINEVTWSEVNFEEEAQADGKPSRMKVWGCVQEADSVNRNKRIYPRETLEETLKELNKRVSDKRVFGEVDHPMFKGQLKDTSHLVTKVWWDEENPKRVMAEMLVLNTPAGAIVQEIIRAGGRPGFSSRGSGKTTPVEMKGHGKVERIEPGFRFESFDFVIDPSVRPAKITKIMEDLNIPWEEKDDTKEECMDKPTIEDLKKSHPDIVAALTKEVTEQAIAERAKMTADFETEKAALADKVKAQVTAEAERAKAEAERETAIKTRDEELTKLRGRATELEDELNKKDEELAKHLDALENIVAVLTKGEYIKVAHQAVQDDETKAKDVKIAELTKALEDEKAKVSAVEAKVTAAEAEAKKIADEAKVALEAEKANTAKVSVELGEMKAIAQKKDEEAEAAAAKAFVAQKLNGNKFAAFMGTKLEGVRTVKEAEERFNELASLVKTVEEGLVPPPGDPAVGPEGKGREAVLNEEEKPESTDEGSLRERIKARAGISKK
jgi:hypothetical protein